MKDHAVRNPPKYVVECVDYSQRFASIGQAEAFLANVERLGICRQSHTIEEVTR